jgi:hypothetical protein
MLNEFIKEEYLSLWKRLGGQGAEVLAQGTGTGTIGVAVGAEVEVGEDLKEIDIGVVETETIVAGVEAGVQVLTTAETVEEEGVSAVGALLIEVTLLAVIV